MKRNGYLIDNYIKSYMLATILTTAVLQINGMMDAFITGHYIGAEALASITVATPVSMGVNCICSLFVNGAVILAGKAFGRRDILDAGHIFIASLASVVITGIIVSVSSLFFTDLLANRLCLGNDLYEYVREYLSVFLLGTTLVLLNSCLSMYTDIGGNPKVVTQTSIVNCITNIIVGLILIVGLGMGIKAAALSTLSGAAVSVLWILRFMKSDKSPYQLELKSLNLPQKLKDNVKQGFPLMLNTLGGIALTTILNTAIQVMQGAGGMFTLSIMMNIIGISLLLASGSASTLGAIGSTLIGRGDYVGFKMLFNRCLVIAISSSVLATLLIQIFPRELVGLFGASNPQILENAVKNLPIVSWFSIALCLLGVMAINYRVLNKLMLCTYSAVSLPILMAAGFALVYFMDMYDYVWYVFPVATGVSLLIILLSAEIYRFKSKEKLSLFTLIPCADNTGMRMEISLPRSREGIIDGIVACRDFCAKHNFSDNLTGKVLHCMEELMLNIVNYSGRNANSYIDIGITRSDDGIKGYVQDNGKAFDPVNIDAEKRSLEIKILHKNCDKLEYQFSFGQNITYMAWDYETA